MEKSGVYKPSPKELKNVEDTIRDKKEFSQIDLSKAREEGFELGKKSRDGQEQITSSKLQKANNYLDRMIENGEIVTKTIQIGGKTGNELEHDLENNGFKIQDAARLRMRSEEFIPLTKTKKVNLVMLSVEKMGFSKGATLEQIYSRIGEFGLNLVTDEVGAQYLLQRSDERKASQLKIGMKPFTTPSDELRIFEVNQHYIGGELGTSDGNSNKLLNSTDIFIFCRE